MKAFRTVFFGTPPFAVPVLSELAELTTVTGVVCQPDRRSGRGMQLRAPAVKERALELGLPLLQPEKVRDGALLRWLRERSVDAAIVAAYGRILPGDVLSAPRMGCINLHASLLPAYRGAAPIQWALLDGRAETGISLMQMDEGMDTGAVYSRHLLPIPRDCNAGELTQSLAELAREVLREKLIPVLLGQLQPVPQDEALATQAPPIGPRHLSLVWERPASDIENQVRALAPRPGATCLLGGRRLKILRATARNEPADAAPGSVVEISDAGPVVACGRGRLLVETAQVEGRPARTGRDLVNGRVLSLGVRLASPETDAR